MAIQFTYIHIQKKKKGKNKKGKKHFIRNMSKVPEGSVHVGSAADEEDVGSKPNLVTSPSVCYLNEAW